MAEIIAIVGDLHINSSVALCPPVMVKDDGQTITPSKSQQWLWKNWLNFWATVKTLKTEYNAQVTAHFNGDGVDINRHSKFQLMTFNDADILRWALGVLQPARQVADIIFIERGTEAHTGGSGYLEEQLAQSINAERDAVTASWWYFEGEAEGLRYVVTHHPGTNSLRPWTQGSGANRAAAMVVDAYYGDAWQPHLAIFGHVHHNEDSGDNHPVRAIFNRGWTLKNAYDYRGGRGIQKSVIGGIIVIVDGTRYIVKKMAYELPRKKPWTKT
jgi:hypothetical protein